MYTYVYNERVSFISMFSILRLFVLVGIRNGIVYHAQLRV